ncbi:MAG TPA: UDP-N-acetylmuramate dehydrogenase [Vicinamibacterales bacterium]|nr:UDP-N-acetylmuramate dehydrogenase [Vicinamibacterales bacterium]
MADVLASFEREFGRGRAVANAPLAPFTTFRVGGPADWLLETRSSDEILRALRVASSIGVPVTILGGGSNVLVADMGVRGLVIRPRAGAILRTSESRVRADAGVTMNGLVRWTVLHGAAGLEAWAGTPGTVGGAVFGNAHFGGRNVGELIDSVELATRFGEVSRVAAGELGFAYDRSRLQTTGEVLISATFVVGIEEPGALRTTARASLAFRKRTQPLESPSAGCVFQNPQRVRDVVPEGIPWSAGALVDRAGLKGVAIGGARVSAAHGNFIINEGGATAAEIKQLVERCRRGVREQFGVELRDEIVCLGEFE